MFHKVLVANRGDAGAHVLAIKDMAGLLRAPAAATLVLALRSRFDLPVHLHTHDTAGGQLATLVSAINAGVDAVDVASAPMSGTTSQPSMSALIAATEGTERQTGLGLQAACDLEPYWEKVRQLYAPFESGLPSPTGRVYTHEIPGGQLSNLRQQAIALGLGERFESIENMYAAANTILGNVVKVTPSSKAVGDLALALMGANADPADFEANPTRYDLADSIIGFLNEEPGDPLCGWPELFPGQGASGPQSPGTGQRPQRRGHCSLGCSPAERGEPLAVPRTEQGVCQLQGVPTATCPCSAPATSCTAWRSAPNPRWSLSQATPPLGRAVRQRPSTNRACVLCRCPTSRLRSTFGRPRERTPHSRVRLPQRSPVSSRSRLRSVNR